MPTKKDKYRFTLRFNSSSEIHVTAARILNTKGHGISEYVAQAVCAYTVDKQACGYQPASSVTDTLYGLQNDLANTIRLIVSKALDERETQQEKHIQTKEKANAAEYLTRSTGNSTSKSNVSDDNRNKETGFEQPKPGVMNQMLDGLKDFC